MTLRGPLRPKLPLILASSSPRRQAMLAGLGLHFMVRVPAIDESVPSGKDPVAHALVLARAKAAAINAPQAVIIAADTVVALGDCILGKPRDLDEAFHILKRLAGAEHHVHTAVALRHGSTEHTFAVSAQVRMAAFAPEVLRAYAATGEGLDKAGAYAVQGVGSFMVESVHGSVSAVIGLPLAETVTALLRMDAVEPAS